MKRVVKYLFGSIKAILNGIKIGKKSYIGLTCKIYNKGEIIIGDFARIRPGTGLYTNPNCTLVLGNHVEIGRNSTIASHNRVILEDNVLTGPHVFIADYNHEYENVNLPISKQGDRRNINDSVVIGEGSWLGTNVVIAGNVHIGKNCVIGANSVVTKDIPDFCVAVGIPAKVVKKYNSTSNTWEKI